MQKLLSQKCIEQVSAALKYEGANSITLAFEGLGRVAAMNLMSDPNVIRFTTGANNIQSATK